MQSCLAGLSWTGNWSTYDLQRPFPTICILWFILQWSLPCAGEDTAVAARVAQWEEHCGWVVCAASCSRGYSVDTCDTNSRIRGRAAGQVEQVGSLSHHSVHLSSWHPIFPFFALETWLSPYFFFPHFQLFTVPHVSPCMHPGGVYSLWHKVRSSVSSDSYAC